MLGRDAQGPQGWDDGGMAGRFEDQAVPPRGGPLMTTDAPTLTINGRPLPLTLASLPLLLREMPTADLDARRWLDAVRKECQRRTVVLEEQPDGTWVPRP